jgi:pentatricopeptide repeat protein
LTEALGWLTIMETPAAGPIEPCVVTYNTLIHVASQANDLLTAQRLYHAMLAKGIQADAFTYTTLLQCMATMGDLQGVEDMLARLETKKLGGLIRNTVTWNMLLDCYYTHVAKYGDIVDERVTIDDNSDGNDDDNDTLEGIGSSSMAANKSYKAKADSMFHAMVEALNEGSPTVPVADAITFQIYIDHLLRQDQRDDAIHTLLESMPQIQPTITMYNRLFASFKSDPIPASSLKLQQLYTSFQQQHHLRPTTETLDALVNALLDQQEPTLALKTFVDLSQQENLSPCPELIERLSDVLEEQQEQQEHQLSHAPSST